MTRGMLPGPSRTGSDRTGMVDPIGTIRRYRALACLGYSIGHQELATGLALNRMVTAVVIPEAEAQVMARFYQVARQMVAGGPGAVQVQGRAVRAGWIPPALWAPGDIDRPWADPTGIGRLERQRSWAQTYEIVAGRGLGPRYVARTLLLTRSSLNDRIRRCRAHGFLPAKPVTELHPCGTPAAAERHRRRGEPLDDACRRAKNNYRNAWRSARKGEVTV